MSTKKRSHERNPFSLSQASWIGFFTKILLCCWFHYFSILSRFSEPFWKLPEESRLRPAPYNTSLHSKFRQTALKFNNTEKSRLQTNWHFTRTVYHWSLILRSFRVKPKLIEDNANGFMKALYHHSRIFELATPCPKIKILRLRKKVSKLLFWCEISCKIWSCTTKNSFVDHCESLQEPIILGGRICWIPPAHELKKR